MEYKKQNFNQAINKHAELAFSLRSQISFKITQATFRNYWIRGQSLIAVDLLVTAVLFALS
jgi:hypothetical protein